MMPGGSGLVIPHCRMVLLDAVQYTDTFGSVTFIVAARVPWPEEEEPARHMPP